MVSKAMRPGHRGQSSWGASPCKCRVQMCPTCLACFCYEVAALPVRVNVLGNRDQTVSSRWGKEMSHVGLH